jgi:hypothetical protein
MSIITLLTFIYSKFSLTSNLAKSSTSKMLTTFSTNIFFPFIKFFIFYINLFTNITYSSFLAYVNSSLLYALCSLRSIILSDEFFLV